MNEARCIPFRVDWYELLQNKDTAEKKVAFLEGIVEYFLNGTVPPSPRTMKDPKGADYARHDGYLVSHMHLDFMHTKQEAGRKGGYAGRGITRNKGNSNAAVKDETIANQKQNNSTTIANQNKEKNKKEKNNIATVLSNSSVGMGADAPAVSSQPPVDDDVRELPPSPDGKRPATVPTDEEMSQFAAHIGVPNSYLPAFVKRMEEMGWGYIHRNGSLVALNRRNFKAVLRSFYDQHLRNEEKSKEQGRDTLGVKIDDENYEIRL